MKYVYSNISEVSYSMLETFTTTLGGNWMANRKLNYDEIYELIMECRNSGLSDRQWCIDHDIKPSTFYYWIRKLRQMACYDIPEHFPHDEGAHCVSMPKQDVVCVDMSCITDHDKNLHSAHQVPVQSAEPIVLQYCGANIMLTESFNNDALCRVLRVLKATVC